MVMKEVAIIGAGSWGTALAIVLADNGLKVRLWGRRKQQIDEINQRHTNSHYLPGVNLSTEIVAYDRLDLAVKDVGFIVLVTPTKSMREVLDKLQKVLTKPVLFIHASKGIEPKTSKRISEIIEEEIPENKRTGVVVLSGPSHAEEVSLRQPTTVAVSSKSPEASLIAQDLFINQNFRVYTNDDIIGVELGGALKNIIALGAGISDGLNYGDNAKAALITRGLSEITRLGVKMGADPLTFTGLAGMGDLIVTCTSVHSRNWKAGNMLGQGLSLNEILKKMGMVVEGIRTTEATYFLAKEQGIDMPITNAIYSIIFNGTLPKSAVDELMGRVKTDEHGQLHDLLEDKSEALPEK
jgi:glycerol-3-phosphate dehydrogenase (NAD(P)+)